MFLVALSEDLGEWLKICFVYLGQALLACLFDVRLEGLLVSVQPIIQRPIQPPSHSVNIEILFMIAVVIKYILQCYLQLIFSLL